MAYLDVPRLHFAGKFYADPSTVDNTPANFEPNAPIGKDPAHTPSWNPMGTHTYRFQDAVVTSAVDRTGKVIQAPLADPVVGARFESIIDQWKYPAKLVDLDVDQQGISQIYGLQVRIGMPNPSQPDNLVASVTGVMPATAFSDLWFRLQGGGGIPAFSAAYQSVLTNIVWQNEAASSVLTQLKQISPQALSIRFIVDSYQPIQSEANFRVGRLVGTIGPAFAKEPTGFVMGRRLSAPTSQRPPYGAVFAKVDATRQVLTLDLGNCSPTIFGAARAVPVDGWTIRPSRYSIGLQSTPPVALGTINFTPQMYTDFAGIVEVPIPPGQLAAVQTTPLVLTDVTDSQPVPAVAENPQGLYVDVSKPFFRLNPGEKDTVVLTAMQFGKPAPGVALPLQLIPQDDPDPNNKPAAALPLPAQVTTGPDGTATLQLAPTNPGSPRPPNLDGQVYFIGGPWSNFGNIYALQSAPISVLVFTEYPVPAKPTWDQHVASILTYYASVYPYMKEILDLADFDTLTQPGNGGAIRFAMSLPIENPHHMPVVRDLSAGKRKTIDLWIKNGMPRN